MDIFFIIIDFYKGVIGFSIMLLQESWPNIFAGFGIILILFVIWGSILAMTCAALYLMYFLILKSLIFIQTKSSISFPILSKFLEKKVQEYEDVKKQEDIKLREDLEILIKCRNSKRDLRYLNDNYDKLYSWFGGMLDYHRKSLMAYCRYTIYLSERDPYKYYYDISAFGEDVTDLMVPSLKGRIEKVKPELEHSINLKQSSIKNFIQAYDREDDHIIKLALFPIIKSFLSFQEGIGNEPMEKSQAISEDGFMEIIERFGSEKNITPEFIQEIGDMLTNDPISKLTKTINKGIIADIEYILSIREITGDALHNILNVMREELKDK